MVLCLYSPAVTARKLDGCSQQFVQFGQASGHQARLAMVCKSGNQGSTGIESGEQGSLSTGEQDSHG
eukprot:5556735-Pleurochrysis_carterae.AAC.1